MVVKFDYYQIDYFPSRFDPVREAEKSPIPTVIVHGRREKVLLLFMFDIIMF